ncbi:MAG: hypothetical protein AUH28_13000 [Acidobacteria bacterium 13_1_40CM_56_16]|nr:MAG: hypothetical protein AUH28_13000 [Acidobacteria bacterium 13_1_40CM_56_16]
MIWKRELPGDLRSSNCPKFLRAQEAVEALNGQRMEGNNLRVSEARPLPFRSEGRQAGDR